MVIHCDSNQSVLFLYPRLCVHNVTGLSSGKEYQFRILAENFYGRSDPCEPTAPIKTEMAPEGKLRKEGGLIIIFYCCYTFNILCTILCQILARFNYLICKSLRKYFSHFKIKLDYYINRCVTLIFSDCHWFFCSKNVVLRTVSLKNIGNFLYNCILNVKIGVQECRYFLLWKINSFAL